MKEKLYQIQYKLHPLINIISGQWITLLDPLASTWLQFIIIFVLKNEYFKDFFKLKNLWEYAPFKNFFRGSMPRTPLANAWLRHASQAPKKVGHLWQILHTPMHYY